MQTPAVHFLRELFLTLDQSIDDYKAYLQAGKTFRYARKLKKNNAKALRLLLDHKDKLPASLKHDADAMIGHYSVWTQKWEALAEELKPGPEDEFVFPNTVTFPKQAAASLEAYFKHLDGMTPSAG
ncbi:MAG: hypothetical protein HZA79_07200 [Sphingobacteriales bacterium]|nr:hypothetical protein [Sphingobacteriales bacterium]